MPDWSALAAIGLRDDGDALVALDLAPERLLVLPAYHRDGVPGALPHCLARAGVRDRLLRAAHALPPGMRLVVLDAWRPLSVQQYLYDTLRRVLAERHPELPDRELDRRTREFVAPPSPGPRAPSPHLTGGSVDLTLCDDRGRLLDMGSEFDEVTPRSHTVFYEAPTDAPGIDIRNRRRLLYHAMARADFTNLPSEWWHYDFGNPLWALHQGEPVAMYGATEPESVEDRWRRQLAAENLGK